MCLRDQVSEARSHAPGLTHSIINLKSLDLKKISYGKLSESEAIKAALAEAQQEDLHGFIVQFKKGEVTIIRPKKAGITVSHPQIGRQIGKTDYHVMRSHTTV